MNSVFFMVTLNQLEIQGTYNCLQILLTKDLGNLQKYFNNLNLW